MQPSWAVVGSAKLLDRLADDELFFAFEPATNFDQTRMTQLPHRRQVRMERLAGWVDTEAEHV